jgi:polyphosphate glucokinase
LKLGGEIVATPSDLGKLQNSVWKCQTYWHTRSSDMKNASNVLVVDIGGTNIKILTTGQNHPRSFPSGPKLRPERMISGIKELAKDWKYDVVSIGYCGVVTSGRIAAEPRNLGPGWRDFDFQAAFESPVKIINDAAMQALGSYEGGLLLFLGMGTGLGSALVAEGAVVPMELGHLAYKQGTYEDYLGARGLERLGKKKWQKHVAFVVGRLIEGIHPDDVVLGGGNARKLRELPPGCRLGDNSYAFVGGFRLWDPLLITGITLPGSSFARRQART